MTVGRTPEIRTKHAAYMRVWKRENKDKVNAWNRMWRKHNVETVRGWVRKYRWANPLTNPAHNAVSKAIKTGKLTRMPCIVCGAENSHGHHPDYSDRLNVVWLCPLHHKAKHREECVS